MSFPAAYGEAAEAFLGGYCNPMAEVASTEVFPHHSAERRICEATDPPTPPLPLGLP